MSTLPQDETEFGGVPGQPFPEAKGYVRKDYETLRGIYQTDPMDEAAGAEYTTQKAR